MATCFPTTYTVHLLVDLSRADSNTVSYCSNHIYTFDELCVGDCRALRDYSDMRHVVTGHEKKDGGRVSSNPFIRLSGLSFKSKRTVVQPSWIPGYKQRIYAPLFHVSNFKVRR